MKKCKLQLKDINGIVESEDEISIGEGDTLVMQYPENMSLHNAKQCFDSLRIALDQSDVVGLPNTIRFKVVKSN